MVEGANANTYTAPVLPTSSGRNWICACTFATPFVVPPVTVIGNTGGGGGLDDRVAGNGSDRTTLPSNTIPSSPFVPSQGPVYGYVTKPVLVIAVMQPCESMDRSSLTSVIVPCKDP